MMVGVLLPMWALQGLAIAISFWIHMRIGPFQTRDDPFVRLNSILFTSIVVIAGCMLVINVAVIFISLTIVLVEAIIGAH